MIDVSPKPIFDIASGSSDSAEQLRFWSRYAVRSAQKCVMVRAAELIDDAEALVEGPEEIEDADLDPVPAEAEA